MIAGLVLDDWKLPIFKKHLDTAGYEYEEPIPFTSGTSLLEIPYLQVELLRLVLENAQRECSKLRPDKAVESQGD